jgi:uridine kinase
VVNNNDTPEEIIRITEEISADLKKEYCKKD